jgi:hypothetical protein
LRARTFMVREPFVIAARVSATERRARSVSQVVIEPGSRGTLPILQLTRRRSPAMMLTFTETGHLTKRARHVIAVHSRQPMSSTTASGLNAFARSIALTPS